MKNFNHKEHKDFYLFFKLAAKSEELKSKFNNK